MYVITIKEIKEIVSEIWVSQIIQKIENRLQVDFLNWDSFCHSVRYAHYIEEWAIELMPVWNDEYFSYKYVNGHPANTLIWHPSVMWIWQLSECKSGEPILLSEMTILTALRTAATTAFASSFFPCQSAKHIAIIGNGSQSIFQTIALCEKYKIKKISHFDIDYHAMLTYYREIKKIYPDIEIVSSDSGNSCIENADIVITITEAFGKQTVFHEKYLKNWACIFAIWWDCPWKTELDIAVLKNSHIIVEYEAQTRKEWEIQNYPEGKVFANLHELASWKKTLKDNKNKYYLFDGVWVWIEDYSALQVIYDIIEKYDYCQEIDLIPKNMNNLKNLYGYIFE